MSKEMEVNQCLECKYFYAGECTHPDTIEDVGKARHIGTYDEVYRGRLASWCPLPDYLSDEDVDKVLYDYMCRHNLINNQDYIYIEKQ